jgi:hypothetical protein
MLFPEPSNGGRMERPAGTERRVGQTCGWRGCCLRLRLDGAAEVAAQLVLQHAVASIPDMLEHQHAQYHLGRSAEAVTAATLGPAFRKGFINSSHDLLIRQKLGHREGGDPVSGGLEGFSHGSFT